MKNADVQASQKLEKFISENVYSRRVTLRWIIANSTTWYKSKARKINKDRKFPGMRMLTVFIIDNEIVHAES